MAGRDVHLRRELYQNSELQSKVDTAHVFQESGRTCCRHTVHKAYRGLRKPTRISKTWL